MMTNPAHWPKTEEIKKTFGQVLWDTKTPIECLTSRWEDRKESQREWCEQAARNVITEYEARRAPFAREHFQKGLFTGLSLLNQANKKMLKCNDDCTRHVIYIESLADSTKLIKQSDDYPLTWQPPKEGESLL